MKTLNFGIVGFGKLGLLHSALVNTLPNSKLTAIVESSEKMLSFIRPLFPNLKLTTDYEELLSENLSGVLITTPTHLHVKVATEFVKAGIPVFIEKPLSLTADECCPLLDELKNRPVPNMVGYMNRYHDIFCEAKKILDEGTLGRLQTFRVSMYISQLFKKGKGWRYDRSLAGGGVLITQNSHLIDLMQWMFGEIEEVSGHERKVYSESVEDAFHGFLYFKNGLTGFMDSSWSMKHFRTLTIQLYVQGEHGSIEMSDDEIKLYLDGDRGKYQKGWTQFKKPDCFHGVSFDVGGPTYTRQAHAFLEGITQGKRIESDILSAYRVQCVIDALYRSSSERGKPIKVEFS